MEGDRLITELFADCNQIGAGGEDISPFVHQGDDLSTDFLCALGTDRTHRCQTFIGYINKEPVAVETDFLLAALFFDHQMNVSFEEISSPFQTLKSVGVDDVEDVFLPTLTTEQ
ncbi:MAG: hypothetical protein BWY50_00046 [Spirochaetes bacterium ADurb.Bin315]|nr:MAG: hypothetical protein BWY50_00046 [Spirochaetes bacterium ADurb.Bin315]